jgi:hypothetical protein
MSFLRIHLFGNVRVDHDELPTERSMGRAVKALLGYLTIMRQRFHWKVSLQLFHGKKSELPQDNTHLFIVYFWLEPREIQGTKPLHERPLMLSKGGSNSFRPRVSAIPAGQ